VAADDVSLREGSPSDLQATFALSDRTMFRQAVDMGYLPAGERSDTDIADSWGRHGGLVQFLDAQPNRRYLIAENSQGPIAFARIVQFGAMEQLTDLMVTPSHQGTGVGRLLLEGIWAGGPSPSLGRLVVATGAPRDLSLYTEFGVMPVAGHWHMRQETSSYLQQRSQETDATEAGTVVVLTVERAVAEWKRLEPEAIAHERTSSSAVIARASRPSMVMAPRRRSAGSRPMATSALPSAQSPPT
jgi:GNAT superfamily N-acetyltransferase